MYLIQTGKSLVVAIFVIALCACGGGAGGEENSSENMVSTASLDIVGTWLSNCYYDEGVYTVDQFVFSENTVEISFKSFSSDTCTGSPVDEEVIDASYKVRRAIKTVSGRDAVEIDYTITYQGQTFVVLDLISHEGNKFYYGNATDSPSRPEDVDTNIIMTKKTWSFANISKNFTGTTLDLDATKPEVAFDTQGNAIAVWSHEFFESRHIWFNYYSSDNESWGEPMQLENNTGHASFPQIKFDSHNNATVVWYQGYSHVGDYTIWAIRYDSDTATWGSQQKLEKDKGNISYPQIAIDDAGNVMAAWSQRSEGEVYFNLWSNRYDAQTGLWGTAELVESAPGHTSQLKIASDPAGNVTAVWQKGGHVGQLNVWANRYDINQNKWGTERLLETDDSGIASVPQVAMDINGNTLAIWQQHDGVERNIYSSSYNIASDTWSKPAVIDSEQGEAWLPKFAFDQQGNAQAVWLHQNGLQDNVWTSRYNASIKSWEQPVQIESNNELEAKFPEISVDQEGNAIAVWQHHDGLKYNIWMNRYSVIENGWGDGERIESQNEYDARYPKIAMSSQGKSMAVWEQYDGDEYSIRAKIFE